MNIVFFKTLIINKDFVCRINMRKSFYWRAVLPFMMCFGVGSPCGAQVIVPRTLDMRQVVELAHKHSIASMSNRNNFAASYWSYRSYRAQLLPSLSLNANLVNFNRSLVQLQDYNSGAISYRANYNMKNDVSLNFRQNIPWTGGSLSLSTQLSRLDQYSPARLTTYYAQPVYLTYAQTLCGYNQFKWRKETEPKQYEIAKRQYIESMEQLSQTTVALFWNCVSTKESYERAVKSFDEGKRLFEAGRTRFEMGTITRDQLMQIEVRILNDSLSVSNSMVNLRTTMNRLCSYIGYQEDNDLIIIIDYNIPDITHDYNDVVERALQNSSFSLRQDMQYIQADESVARAKAGRSLSASVNARFGMSGSADRFDDTFIQLKDQEVIGVQFTIPILDWGQGRGNVRMAEARAQTTRYELEQSLIDYRQELYTQVMQFNDQRSQCEIARRVALLAEESYESAFHNFGSGSMSMTQLDQLKEKRDQAVSLYLDKVAGFWKYYFGIRRATLFDYESGVDISAHFDKLVK